jgi:integrase
MASVRKRSWTAPDGTNKFAWQVDYRDQCGKRHSKQFQRKKNAETWLNEAMWEVGRGVHTHDNDSITVAEAGKLWLEAKRADALEPSTISAYDQHLRLHINPICGSVKLSQLSTPVIEGYRDKLINILSRPMASRVLRSLKAILSEAMRHGYVAQNVATAVKIKRQARVKSKFTIPSQDKLRVLIEAAGTSKNPASFPLYCLLIFGGLRASELRGLSWSYVHLSTKKVEVAQRADRAGNIGAPKTAAAHRIIPLPDIAINALRAWKLACPISDENLVFPSLAGKATSWNYLMDHLVDPVQIDAGEFDSVTNGLTEIVKQTRWGLHDFRHAAASLWIEQQVNPKRVQYLMGHSSITVTFDTYGHLFEQSDKDAGTSVAIEKALFGDAT